MKLTIPAKDAFLDNLEKPVMLKTTVKEVIVKERKGLADFDHYMFVKRQFIDKCVDRGFTFQEVGDLLGCTKQAVYQYYTYHSGFTGKVKERIRQRDKKCRLCGRKKGKMHVHHLGSHRKHTLKNLVLLCPRCHKIAEKAKKGMRSYPQLAN